MNIKVELESLVKAIAFTTNTSGLNETSIRWMPDWQTFIGVNDSVHGIGVGINFPTKGRMVLFHKLLVIDYQLAGELGLVNGEFSYWKDCFFQIFVELLAKVHAVGWDEDKLVSEFKVRFTESRELALKTRSDRHMKLTSIDLGLESVKHRRSMNSICSTGIMFTVFAFTLGSVIAEARG